VRRDEGDGYATGVGGDLDEGLLPGRGEQPSGVAGAGGGDARGVHGVDRAARYSGMTSGFRAASQAGWAKVVRVQAVVKSRATRVGVSGSSLA